MPTSLSVNSVIDKNKITSGAVWAILLDIQVVDPNTREIVDTISVAANNEDILFDGVNYKAANFALTIDQKQNEAPTVSIVAQDQTGYILQRVDAMAGGVLSNVIMTVVNTQRLDKPPELQDQFQLTNSSAKNGVVTFQLGAENPLGIQFPKHVQRQDRCAWRYRGYGCAYTGSMVSCDYTKDGANGCKAHDNLKRFRALSGLVRMNI